MCGYKQTCLDITGVMVKFELNTKNPHNNITDNVFTL